MNKKLGFIGLIIILNVACQKERQLPNIVFILADDMGQTQLACYGGPYDTPNIDQLAKQGMRFSNAYSSAAVCSPTRAALMTGKYPARLHLTDFIKGEDFPDSLLKQPDWQKFLPLKEVTIAEALKQQGYKTASFGKWHLSIEKQMPESAPYNPDKQGFDESFVTFKPRGDANPEKDPHNIEAITSKALTFLEENKDHPFFLYLPHNAIHDPIMAPKDRVDKYRNKERLESWEIRPEIAAMVNHLDESVGKVLAKLDDLDLSENTIVVFYGDNGGKRAYAEQRPYRAGKGWLYEGGIRVPLIVKWPQKVQASSQSDAFVSSIDFFPTLLDAVGAASIEPKIDGKSFYNTLLGKKSEREKSLYWHYPHYHRGSGMKPASAMRKGKYKLVEWHELLLSNKQGAYELYNLEADSAEQNNLVASKPDVLEALISDLQNWKQQVGAQMPELQD